MSASAPTWPSAIGPALQQGQALEAAGRFPEAVAWYDRLIAALSGRDIESDPARRRDLGLAWMNRGNALQQIAIAPSLAESVDAYDRAIALFRTLPLAAEPAFRNHLGAAWLNRGRALIGSGDLPRAVGSFEQAIGELGQLPLDDDISFRLNLAGAWTNVAHGTLESEPSRSAAAARTALRTIATVERTHDVFTMMSLRARRALVTALGRLLMVADAAGQSVTALTEEATDMIEDGLALIREREDAAATAMRPLAARLFRLGAQLYRLHQPHFLAEYVLEVLAAPAFRADSEFHAAAIEEVGLALEELRRPRLVTAADNDVERRLAAFQNLRAAQEHLSRLNSASSLQA